MKIADRNCGWSALGPLDAGYFSPKLGNENIFY